MPCAPIPEFEQEVVAAGAKKRSFGEEKIPTTSLKCVEVLGVFLSSRYQKADELRCMARMVEGVEGKLRSLIDSIWCDSQACACYSVELKACSKIRAREIAYQLQNASGGHNGISLSGSQGGHFDLDPFWDEGEE